MHPTTILASFSNISGRPRDMYPFQFVLYEIEAKLIPEDQWSCKRSPDILA